MTRLLSEEDKLLVEIQNIDNHKGVPLKNRITANEMKQILELVKQYTLSKQIEARIDELEKFGATVNFNGDPLMVGGLSTVQIERITELCKRQEELK